MVLPKTHGVLRNNVDCDRSLRSDNSLSNSTLSFGLAFRLDYGTWNLHRLQAKEDSCNAFWCSLDSLVGICCRFTDYARYTRGSCQRILSELLFSYDYYYRVRDFASCLVWTMGEDQPSIRLSHACMHRLDTLVRYRRRSFF